MSDETLSHFEKYDYLVRYIQNVQYDKAKKEIHNTKEDLNDPIESIYLDLLLCQIVRLSGNFTEANDKLKLLEARVMENWNIFLTLNYHLEKTWVLRMLGDLSGAISHLDILEKQFQLIKNTMNDYIKKIIPNLEGNYLHNKAVIKLWQGDIDASITITKKCLDIRRETGITSEIADSLNNLGVMLSYKDNFEETIEVCMEALKYRKLAGNNAQTALTYSNLIQFYTEQGIEYRQNAKNYLKEFEGFIQNNPPAIGRTELLFKYSNGVFLASSPRFRDKAKAESIFEEILLDPDIDIEHKFQSYYFMVALLLQELKMTQESEIFYEITTLINQVQDFSKETGATLLILRSSVLKSKMHLLKGKFSEAKRLLNEAINLAIEMDDKRLLRSVSRDYDDLLSNEDRLMSLHKTQDISEIISISDIEYNISEIIRKESGKLVDEDEVPIAFILMHRDTGTSIFSKTFDQTVNKLNINEHLVPNFLSAIISFGNELFASEGSLERIKHEDYTILMEPRGKVIYNYIFKGSSYYPSLKIKNIINQLVENPDFNNLMDNYQGFSNGQLGVFFDSVIYGVIQDY